MFYGITVEHGIECASDEEMHEKFITDLQRDLSLSSHGALEWCLVCKIVKDFQKDIVTINQERYTKDVLERFKMQDTKPVATPGEAGMHLSGYACPSKEDEDKEEISGFLTWCGLSGVLELSLKFSVYDPGPRRSYGLQVKQPSSACGMCCM